MVLRFQRRIQLMPGVRLNVSKRGLGVSVGPRGAAVSVGPRGVHRHLGIPGTGIAFREQLSGPRGASRSASGGSEEVTVRLEDDGKLGFYLADGSAAPQTLVRRIRSTHGEGLQRRLDDWAAERNAELDACLGIHLETPPPVYKPAAQEEPAPLRPAAPAPRPVGFWARLFLQRRRIEAANAAALARYEETLAKWQRDVAAHAEAAREIAEINAAVERGDPEVVSALIGSRLSAIAWAKPTEVSFDFGDDTTTLALDVDLPEIDQIPDTNWVVAARGLSVREQKRSATQKRRDFAYVAHGTLFRIAGEAFASLPTLREVTLSGYTQRPDPATGGQVDVYILSVRIPRAQWAELHFDRLHLVEVTDALARFDLIRRQTRGGELQAIEPHGSAEA